ncbi:MAG: hypothetical protein R3351_07505, partial [Nitrospirales bacterium]|nr:hypothetical protein [Nitrospirales bacterium]
CQSPRLTSVTARVRINGRIIRVFLLSYTIQMPKSGRTLRLTDVPARELPPAPNQKLQHNFALGADWFSWDGSEEVGLGTEQVSHLRLQGLYTGSQDGAEGQD